MLGKELELLNAYGSRLEINQLIFADDTALVADSEKLCRLVTGFGRVCKKIKLRVNVFEAWKWGSNASDTKRRTIRGSGLLKYLASQVPADEGCERDALLRMNEGYSAWGAPKSVLSNTGLGIKAKKSLYEGGC